jgi:hypothetical protein
MGGALLVKDSAPQGIPGKRVSDAFRWYGLNAKHYEVERNRRKGERQRKRRSRHPRADWLSASASRSAALSSTDQRLAQAS